MTLQDLTVLMVSRNAETTIARALASALAAGAAHIVLVDSSIDTKTIDVARQVVGVKAALHIAHEGPSLTIGAARQQALALAQTPFAIWLDADDAISEDHLHRYHATLTAGNDYVISGVKLLSAPEYRPRATVEISGDLLNPLLPFWCFERNWYPSLHAGVRTSWAQNIGFNSTLKGAEDHDFLLRAVHDGARMAMIPGASYLYTETPGSLSRDLTGRAADGAITARYWLDQPDFKDYLAEKLDRLAARYIMVCLSVLAGDWDRFAALALELAGDKMVEASLEHPVYQEPIPLLTDFVVGTARVQRGLDGVDQLVRAAEQSGNPAFANNAAVALAPKDPSAALSLLEKALAVMPHYKDALANKISLDTGRAHDLRLTRLPMRPIAFRDRY